MNFPVSNTGMTTMNVKQINRNKVYAYIHKSRSTCKQHLTQSLQMGLSTVTQNLKELEEEGLIRKNGTFDSTGGRKADAVEIVPDARISIGVALLERMVHFVATDLYGTAIHSHAISLPFHADESYYRQVGGDLNDFIASCGLDTDRILGVAIATQGIIAKDGQSVSYGVLLDNSAMRLSDLQRHIPYPCRLEHDSKAAAALELWNNPAVKNGVVILLNRNLGGAIIAQGVVQGGDHMHSGTIEHLRMCQDGDLCYCGQRGCLETLCSANSLAQSAGTSIPDFFRNLRRGNKNAQIIWNNYLENLALAIRNLSVVMDGTFLLSGYLASYLEEFDVSSILTHINSYATFPLTREDIIVGAGGQFTQAIGASLHLITAFLEEI